MARKSKPRLSQAEQSKRFIEAAREAGVDESEGILEEAIRKMARPATETKDFQGITEKGARQKLEDWKIKHPKAKIIREETKFWTGVGSAEGRKTYLIRITFTK